MFQDKVILVTGAAGGVGHAVARSFAAEGARVAVCDMDHQAGAKLVQEL
ncbi:MAG: SDR family NAD(P)-dependent oxidoreductase, partial [Alphaproteobacteria bacterium]